MERAKGLKIVEIIAAYYTLSVKETLRLALPVQMVLEDVLRINSLPPVYKNA